TDRALDTWRHDLEHAAGAGAEIEEIADSMPAQRLEHGGLDLAFIDMERAYLVPLLSIGPEIGVRRLGALALHGVEPCLVERHSRVVARHGSADLPRQLRTAATRREAVVDPGALAEPVEQPGIAQQLQVA